MKEYNVYSKVYQMREAGFSQRAVTKALGINRKTVNRYSVPLGTNNTDPEVQLEIAGGNLRILTVFGDFLCEHQASTGRGLLIQNKSHLGTEPRPLTSSRTVWMNS